MFTQMPRIQKMLSHQYFTHFMAVHSYESSYETTALGTSTKEILVEPFRLYGTMC